MLQFLKQHAIIRIVKFKHEGKIKILFKKQKQQLSPDEKKIQAICIKDKKFKRLYRLSKCKLYLRFFKRKFWFYLSKIAWSILICLLPTFGISQWSSVTNQIMYMPNGISSRYVVLNEHMSYFWAIIAGAFVILAGMFIVFKVNWNYDKHLAKYDLDKDLINWRTYKTTQYPKMNQALLEFYNNKHQKNDTKTKKTVKHGKKK